MPSKSILFVDDELNILRGLKRMLHRYSDQWDMYFAAGGEEALKELGKTSVDVLVTDMKMPGMSGVELMQKVKEQYPEMVRIVLSGHSEREDVIKSAALAHKYLAKPCKSDQLINVINQSYYHNTILKNHDVKRIISNIEALPSLPKTYNKLMEELSSDDFSLKQVGKIISEDMGMSTSILKQVNSSFWGLANHISSPEQAVNMLGGEIIQALVLSSHIFGLVEDTDLISINDVERKSQLNGRFAKILGDKLTENRVLRDNGFISALLQDLGTLILVNNFPDTYRVILEETAKNPGWEIRQAESTIMGVTHAEVGAYLLGLWGMPEDIVTAVALHHTPRLHENENDLVTAISYVACQYVTLFEENEDPQVTDLTLDLEYCQGIGVYDKVISCFDECLEIYREVTDES